MLSLLVLTSSPAQAQSSKRVALLIGNASYTVGRLTNPPNDVREMEAALRSVGFQVQTVLNANQNQMKRAVRDFGSAAQGADVAFFYYSGHATQARGENYLIPVQATIEKEADYEVEAVSAHTIMAQIVGARPKAAIVVLDACRDNPLAATAKSTTKGLGRMDAPSGTMIAFATSPNNTASDEGHYARALASQLKTPGLELFDVFRNTTDEVRRLSGGKQEPRLSEVSITERIYLAGRGGIAAVTPAIRTPPQQVASVVPEPGPVLVRPAGASTAVPAVLIANFGGDTDVAKLVPDIISADLRRDGRFSVLNIDGVGLTEQSRPDMNHWAGIGANFLVTGSARAAANNKFDVRFRAWDVAQRLEIGGLSFVVAPEDLRLAAHRIADWVHAKLLGKPGAFSLRVAQVLTEGPRFKLMVSDSDGANPQPALTSPKPVAMPSWFGGQHGQAFLSYFSFESGRPALYVHQVSTGTRTLPSAADMNDACASELATFSRADEDTRSKWFRDDWITQAAAPCATAMREFQKAAH